MDDNGGTKDDVKLPEGEVGDKINRLFRGEEKDTSEFMWNGVCYVFRTNDTRCLRPDRHGRGDCYRR